MIKKKERTAKKFVLRKEKKTPMKLPEDADAKKKGIRTPQLLRGMKDLLPRDEMVWQHMREEAKSITRAYGFMEVETPILEEAALFIRSIGRGTDVVEKEMYLFEDRDGTKVSLRPEATAGIARAYIAHGLQTLSQPVKLWTLGPMFRHDRPQAGRYRQFHQFDCEIIGERDPIIDAELIVVAYNFLKDLGIEVRLDVNSMGSPEDRARYVEELVGYLRTKRSYLCEDCKKRMGRNPLRVLDCKEERCQPVIEDAPQIIDWLSETSKNYFMKVLEYLDELSVPYMLRSTLVRGLDYYTDTVFELYAEEIQEEAPAPVPQPEGVDVSLPITPGPLAPDRPVAIDQPVLGAQSALGGGGRYDRLLEQLGGNPTSACGFAIGLERVATLLRAKLERDPEALPADRPKVFVAQLGEQARRRALKLVEDLRKQGIVVRHNLGKPSLKGQLELANKYGATHTVIIGQKEVQDGTVIVRDMESGIQETIDQKKLKAEVERITKA